MVENEEAKTDKTISQSPFEFLYGLIGEESRTTTLEGKSAQIILTRLSEDIRIMRLTINPTEPNYRGLPVDNRSILLDAEGIVTMAPSIAIIINAPLQLEPADVNNNPEEAREMETMIVGTLASWVRDQIEKPIAHSS